MRTSLVGCLPCSLGDTIWLSGLSPDVVATEPVTWAGAKALFRRVGRLAAP